MKEILPSTGQEKVQGYLGASANRRRIDILSIGEIFTIGGFSFRNEDFISSAGYKKAGHPSFARPNEPTERTRHFPDLERERARRAREKAKENEARRRDRGQNRNRGMIQVELL